MVLEKFIQVAAQSNGIFVVEEWIKDIWILLEKHARDFIKHGFNYKWVRIIRNKTTGEIQILIRVGTNQDDEEFEIPFWTGLFDHEEPKKPWHRQEEEDALLLFASVN